VAQPWQKAQTRGSKGQASTHSRQQALPVPTEHAELQCRPELKQQQPSFCSSAQETNQFSLDGAFGQDKDVAELFRAQTAAAFKLLPTVTPNTSFVLFQLPPQNLFKQDCIIYVGFPSPVTKTWQFSIATYPRVLLRELQPSHLHPLEAKHKQEQGAPGFRSDPKTLLKPCKDHAVHVSTHTQQLKKWSCSLQVMLKRLMLLNNSIWKNGA